MNIRSILSWLGLTLVLGGLLASVPRVSFLAGDGHLKYVQVESFVRQGMSTEDLYYPGRSIDPDFRFYPLMHMVSVGERHLSVFPALLTVLSLPAYLVGGPGGVVWAGLLVCLLCLWLLRKYWDVATPILWVAALATPLLWHSVGFYDVALTNILLFIGCSIFLHKAFQAEEASNSGIQALIAGALAGLAIWLRLEALLFTFCLALGALIYQGLPLFKNRNAYLFSAGFLGLLIAFLIFNYFNYGHPGGLRFTSNYAGAGVILPYDRSTLHLKFKIIVSILFTNGARLGFLAYMPVLIPVFIYLGRTSIRQKLQAPEAILLYVLLIYIPLGAFLSPNDGNIDWGSRYLSPAILPALVLMNLVWSEVRGLTGLRKKASVVLVSVLIIFSTGVTLVARKVLKNSGKQLKNIQREFGATDAEIQLFQSRILVGHLGQGYFKGPRFLAKKPEELGELLAALRERAPNRRLAFFEMRIPKEYRHLKGLDTMTSESRKEYYQRLKTKLKFLEKRDLKYTTISIYRIPDKVSR